MRSAKAKRRLKILISLVLLAVTSIGTLWAVRKYQVRHEYARYRTEGLVAVAAGDNERGIQLLGKYLGRYSSDVDALVAYAHVRQKVPLPKNAHLLQTAQALRHVLRMDPSRSEQRKELLELYWKSGMAAEALELAGEVLKSNPSDLEAIRQRALSLVVLRKQDEAKAAAQKWAEIDKDNIDAHLLVIGLLVAAKDRIAALGYADGLAAKGVSDQVAQVTRGLARIQADRADEAKAILLSAAQANPTEKAVVLALSDGLERIGQDQQSIAMLKSAAKSGNEEIRRRMLRRVWQSGDLNGYLELVATPSASPESQWAEETALKIVSLRRSGHESEAAQLADALKARSDDLTSAWLAAVDTLSGAPLDESVATGLRDRCLAALSTSPDNPFLILCLAEAERTLGEQDKALRLFLELVSRNPSWVVPILRVSELELALGRADAAVAAARDAFYRASRNVRVAAIFARVWDAAIDARAQNDAPELLRFTEQIQKAKPGEEQSLGVYVRRLSEAGKNEEAKSALANALADDKTTPPEPLLLHWAQISQAHGLGLEQRCVERCQQLYGASPQSAFFESYLMFLSGRGQEGLTSLRKCAQDVSLGSPTIRSSWELTEARYLDLMQSPEAAAYWAGLSERYPNRVGIQQALLLSPTVRQDRVLEAIAIERLRQASGDQAQTWKLARARWLVTGAFSDADAREANSLLNELLKSTLPGTDTKSAAVETRFLLARCFHKLGNLPAAVEHLSTAARLAPESQPVGLYLVQLLQESRDYTAAKEQLDRVSSVGLRDPEERRRAAILFAQQGDPTHAVDLLQDLQGQSRESDQLLAELYYRSDQLGRAQVLSERLMTAPDLTAIRFAADLYTSTGRTDEAEKALAHLDNLNADAAAKKMLQAEYQTKHGSVQKAEELLRNATNEFPENASAWRMLVLNLMLQSRAGDALQAAIEGLKRLPKDEVLAGVVKRKSLVQAATERGLLPLALGIAQSPDDSAVIDAITLLTGADSDRPARVLTYLGQLADRYSNSLPVQIVIIDRYMAFGRPRESASIATRATAAFPFSVDPPKLATRAYSALGDWTQAASMARTWHQRAVGNKLESDLVLADILERIDQHDAAAATLEPYLTAAKDKPDIAAAVVPPYAISLCRADKSEKADAILTPLLGGGGPVFRAWIQAASRLLPREQAEIWVDRMRKASDNSVPSQMTAATANASLAQRFDDATRRANAKQMLNDIAARPDLQKSLLVGIGVYLETIGDVEGAERTYRRAIPDNDPDGLARNNLAMILARRGELGEAMELAKSALQMQPNRAYALDTLAFVQRKTKDFHAAAETMRNAVQREPWVIDWRLTLTEILIEAGNHRDATAELATLSDLVLDERKLPQATQARLRATREELQKATNSDRAASSQVKSTLAVNSLQ